MPANPEDSTSTADSTSMTVSQEAETDQEQVPEMTEAYHKARRLLALFSGPLLAGSISVLRLARRRP